MKTLNRFAAPILAWACVVALTFVSGGCNKPAPAKTAAPARPADAVYTTRGRVESIPDPAKPTSEFHVMHEAIDTFVNPATGALGMDSMSMPFPVDASVPLKDVAVGDVVEFTFGVWYKPSPSDTTKRIIDAYAIQKIVKLPRETELKFGKASPPLGGK